jgi:hypothetical protein
MTAMVQTAYADDNAAETNDLYDVEIEGIENLVPGGHMDLKAVVKKDGNVVDLPEGTHIEWMLGDFGMGYKEKYVIPDADSANPDKYIHVSSEDTTSAHIFTRDEIYGEDPFDAEMGVGAILISGELELGRSDECQFRFATSFIDIDYVYEGGDYDPYLLNGETTSVQVKVSRHQSGEKPVPLEVTYDWTVDNKVAQILDAEGAEVTKVKGTDLVFTFKRVDSSKDTEAHLIITDSEGEEVDNIYFPMNAISNNLADYQIEFNGKAEEEFVFVNASDLPIKDGKNPACEITVVSGNGDGYVLPESEYSLKVQKVIGYNETTWDEVLENSSFPLNVDPAGSSNINGDRTEGTAQYIITAVAKGSRFVGQTGSGTGRMWLLDRKTLTWPSVDAGFPDKHYNLNQFRYEVQKGKKLTPYARSVENFQNLTLNKDYTVSYINKKTNKVYKSFPTKLGEYTVVFSGINSYYGRNDSYTLFVGKKNTLKAKGKTIICKTKMKKGKTKKSKTFKASRAVSVSKAKGEVSYTKVSGNNNITVSDSGKIKVKKGTKKGTYKIKIEVSAHGNSTYIGGTKKVTVKVKVK